VGQWDSSVGEALWDKSMGRALCNSGLAQCYGIVGQLSG